MSDPLLDELLARPIGPTVAKKPERSDLSREVIISKGTAEIEVAIDPATVNEGTALRFLEDEGLTPEEWEVTGFRKIEYGAGMRSVRFTYRRVSEAPEATLDGLVEQWRDRLLAESFNAPYGEDVAGTYVILIADPQFGKKRTEEAVANYKRGVIGHCQEILRLGDKVTDIHVAWMGDETENVVNSYGNQPHTIELNRTQQLELDFDMRVWALRQVLDLGRHVSASSVISNHGEWTRNGGKEPVTTANDNASTYVARQVKRLFDELSEHTGQTILWEIGEDHPGVTLDLAGVECYFSHGYIEKGKGGSVEIKTKSAIERQILGRTSDLADVKIWFMAHYHHFYSNEFEGRTLFGCPALEAERSSEYMLDQFGVWSPPGMLGMLVGCHLDRGWSNLNIF